MSGPGDISAARGGVRDGIAAIQNLAQLLRSPRVGARALARAVPEVREGAAALRDAAQALDQAIAGAAGSEPATARAAHSVLGFAAERARALEAALEVGRRIDVRRRLGLDAEVNAAAAELGTVLMLVDLLGAEPERRHTPVDLLDVLDEQWSAPAASTVVVAVEIGRDATFTGDPRHAASVLELAVTAASAATRANLRLTSERRPCGSLVVRVEPAPAGATPAVLGGDRPEAHTPVPLRAAIPALAEALPAAARHVGFDLAIGPEPGAVAITFQP